MCETAPPASCTTSATAWSTTSARSCAMAEGNRGPTPEASQPLWAPWRMEYLKAASSEGCPLCDALENDRLILHRGRRAFVIMNLYPYSNGHVMIAPIEH